MKINGDEYREVRRRIREIQDLDQMRKEEHWCKIIVTIIFLLVMVWIFSDTIIKVLERDDYKQHRIKIIEVKI